MGFVRGLGKTVGIGKTLVGGLNALGGGKALSSSATREASRAGVLQKASLSARSRTAEAIKRAPVDKELLNAPLSKKIPVGPAGNA